jgi:rfaE bifunctional protein nucleotidyltransferase chain/domain/rfaE bifunctional protein kinase chain/domain
VRRLVVVGDALLDRDVDGTVERLAPDAPVPVLDERAVRPRPGGAGLAAALLAADGHAVTLICALGDDPAGRELAALLSERGVEVADLGLDGTTPEKIRLRADGRPLLRLDRGGGTPRAATDRVRAAVGAADAVLVADYGRGVAALDGVRAAVGAAARRGVAVVWDPHPKGPPPVTGVALVTPNAAEARRFAEAVRAERPGAEPIAGPVAADAALLAGHWRVDRVVVTCGADGAVLATAGDGAPALLAAEPADGGDPCGAGDRFASCAAAALAAGAPAAEAARAAVAAASAFVATGGAGAFAAGRAPTVPAGAGTADGADGAPAREALALAAAVRARGGTVVATGGCFDLLHPGHVQTLRAARALGDCLIVLLNSDASVRRLKGPSRPVVGERDRAAVLEALASVDAVHVFAEDTPVAALERLRPHVWVKGGDYAGRRLPEADALERWGGRIAVVPTLDGHSTTRLIQEATPSAVC